MITAMLTADQWIEWSDWGGSILFPTETVIETQKEKRKKILSSSFQKKYEKPKVFSCIV